MPDAVDPLDLNPPLGEIDRDRLGAWWQAAGTAEPFVLDVQAAERCVCGEEHDRMCVRCSRVFCARCVLERRGGGCPRCGGPVWADGEVPPPGGRNPAMLGY